MTFLKFQTFLLVLELSRYLPVFVCVNVWSYRKHRECQSGNVEFFRGISFVSIIGYFIVFLIYHYKLKQFKNELSISLINIWGMLLVGGELFRMFLIWSVMKNG